MGQYEKVTLDIVVEGTVNALTVADLDTDGDFDIALATSAGVQLVYNNTRERHTLNEGTALRFVHLTAHRRKAPAANDNEQTNRANDGQGAQFQVWYHSIADVDDHLNELGNLYTCAFHAERGVKSQPSGPTLVTLGSAAYAPSVSTGPFGYPRGMAASHQSNPKLGLTLATPRPAPECDRSRPVQ